MKEIPAEGAYDISVEDFIVPPIPKYVERRGFIYMLEDALYPEYFKVGRSMNVAKRESDYNTDRPYPSARMRYVSRMFEDVLLAEKQILTRIYRITSPTTLKLEWFKKEYAEQAYALIEEAERDCK